MKIKITVSGTASADFYPLSKLSDMLYDLLDKINELESRYDYKDLSARLPFEFKIQNGLSALSVKIEEEHET